MWRWSAYNSRYDWLLAGSHCVRTHRCPLSLLPQAQAEAFLTYSNTNCRSHRHESDRPRVSHIFKHQLPLPQARAEAFLQKFALDQDYSDEEDETFSALIQVGRADSGRVMLRDPTSEVMPLL